MPIKVFTHYFIGDHLICYGFMKEFAKRYDEILLTTKDELNHINNVKRLFSSLPNITVTTEHFGENYDILVSSQWWYEQVMPWYDNPYNLWTLGDDMIFDRFWYNMVGVPFYLKWDNFYLERNLNKEKEIFYDILGLNDQEHYIFLHENKEHQAIKRHFINPNIRLINIGDYPDICIFDTTFLIKKSKEIHVSNSSFRTFIDLMNIKHDKLYYHKYTRPYPQEQPACKLNWNIIE